MNEELIKADDAEKMQVQKFFVPEGLSKSIGRRKQIPFSDTVDIILPEIASPLCFKQTTKRYFDDITF
jgi:hypothetical protein